MSTSLPKVPDTGPMSLVPTRTVWTLALNTAISAPPAYDASRVFFSLGDRIVAYDILSGKQVFNAPITPTFEPAVGRDHIYVVDATALTAIRSANGTGAWRVTTDPPLATRPVWGGGWLLSVTGAGAVRAYRADDGHLVWEQPLGVAAHAAPAIAGDRVYVPTTDGRIIALNIMDGAKVWERKIGGLPNEVLALAQRIYVGSTDNFFYCLLAKDGTIDWRWRTGADVLGLPVADDRRVYFVSMDNVLRAMNLVSGAQEWMRALPLRPTSGPTIAGSTIVISGQSSLLRTFNLKDGAPGTDINATDEVTAPTHSVDQPLTGLPMLLTTTRNLSKGAAAELVARTVEPPVVAIAPLPNPSMPVPTPTPPTR